MDRPSVGRIVHYVAYGTPGGEYPAKVCRAAVVTEVDNGDPAGDPHGVVGLCVLNPTGQFFNRGVKYDFPATELPDVRTVRGLEILSDQATKPAPGTWHWPERV